ncbi:hypothetical protein M413DRAFT_281065 [Hebeloma cylindrosporum]|uniref:Uncharacterized protein n=1 Tax=Hebeloma cylindrosporum TaxID=76867 RepID=A0A0C3BYD4_HEBCY|nr:hypothetical protein M413DRAFT_281065 [Hebeloma cylindrosporum h7]
MIGIGVSHCHPACSSNPNSMIFWGESCPRSSIFQSCSSDLNPMEFTHKIQLFDFSTDRGWITTDWLGCTVMKLPQLSADSSPNISRTVITDSSSSCAGSRINLKMTYLRSKISC